MNKPAVVKKIMSIISVLLLGAGSLGCNGKVFSALLDDDDLLGGNLLPILLATQDVIPTVRSITSTTPNGTYNVGDPVNITVKFNTPVLLTGTLNITLETGTTDRVVSVSAASYPSKTLTGTYTVGTGDESPDLDSTGITLVGTLTNKKLTPPILPMILPIRKTLAANKNLVIDGVLPIVSIGAPTDTLINSSGSTSFELTYDYAPTTLDSGDITINGSGVSCSSIIVADAGTITPGRDGIRLHRRRDLYHKRGRGAIG